jgi:hypothetical protein
MLSTLPRHYQDSLKIRIAILAPEKTVAIDIRKYLAGKTGSLPSEDVDELGTALGKTEEKALREWLSNVMKKLGPAQTDVIPTPDPISTAEVVNGNTGNSTPPATARVPKDAGRDARKASKAKTVTKKDARLERKEEVLAASVGHKIRLGFNKSASVARSVMELVGKWYMLHRKSPTDILKNGYGRGAVAVLLGCLFYFIVLPNVVLAPIEFVCDIVTDLPSWGFSFPWTTSALGSEIPQEECLISDGGTLLLDYAQTKMMEDDLSAMRVKWASKTSSPSHTDAEQAKEILSRFNETVLDFEKKYVLPGSKIFDDGASLSKGRTMPRTAGLVAPRRFGFPPLKQPMTVRDPEEEALKKKVEELQAQLDRVKRVLENNLETQSALQEARKQNEELSRVNWYLGALVGGGVVTGMVVIGGPVVAHSLGLTTMFSMGLWAWESISVADLLMLGRFSSIFMDSMDDLDLSM